MARTADSSVRTSAHEIACHLLVFLSGRGSLVQPQGRSGTWVVEAVSSKHLHRPSRSQISRPLSRHRHVYQHFLEANTPTKPKVGVIPPQGFASTEIKYRQLPLLQILQRRCLLSSSIRSSNPVNVPRKPSRRASDAGISAYIKLSPFAECKDWPQDGIRPGTHRQLLYDLVHCSKI
jgi:hypothetical protein